MPLNQYILLIIVKVKNDIRIIVYLLQKRRVNICHISLVATDVEGLGICHDFLYLTRADFLNLKGPRSIHRTRRE